MERVRLMLIHICLQVAIELIEKGHKQAMEAGKKLKELVAFYF